MLRSELRLQSLVREDILKHLPPLFAFFSVLLLVPPLHAQWEPEQRLTFNDSTSSTSYNNSHNIAVIGDTFHIVWFDFREGNPKIFYKQSRDKGIIWCQEVKLTDGPDSAWYPSIIASGRYVHVAWMTLRAGKTETFYKNSSDGGISWNKDTRISTKPVTASSYPSIATWDSKVHIVWVDDRDGSYEINYVRSTDLGTTWETATRLTNKHARSYFPAIAVSGPYVHVVWEDSRDGYNEIYYKRSTNGGKSWGRDVRLRRKHYNTHSSHPTVTAWNSRIYVVWQENRNGESGIFYKRSTLNGAVWGSEIFLSNKDISSYYPTIAVWGPKVCVVWQGSERTGRITLYYKYSIDAGESWSQPNTLIERNDNSIRSLHPSIAAASEFNLVWCDSRDGNFEIYHKRGK